MEVINATINPRLLTKAQRLFTGSLAGRITVAQVVDIRKAFTSIPKQRLTHVARTAISNEQLAELVGKIIQRPLPKGEGIRRGRGIPQGGPLSPMLLNLYLDAYLDKKWDHQRWPMVRYADDMLILTDSAQEAEAAVVTLGNLLRPQGLNLRDEIPDPADLTKGMTAEWLGFTLVMEEGRLQAMAGDDAWEKLEEGLTRAQRDRSDPERAASEVLSGWLEYASPAYRPGKAYRDYRRDFVLRASQLLATVGITPQRIPLRVIHSTWADAYRRWRRRRRRVMYRMDATLRGGPLAPPSGSKTADIAG